MVPVAPRELPSVSPDRSALPMHPGGLSLACPGSPNVWKKGLEPIQGGTWAVLRMSAAPHISAHRWGAQTSPCIAEASRTLGKPNICASPGAPSIAVSLEYRHPCTSLGHTASFCTSLRHPASLYPWGIQHPSASPGHPASLHPKDAQHPCTSLGHSAFLGNPASVHVWGTQHHCIPAHPWAAQHPPPSYLQGMQHPYVSLGHSASCCHQGHSRAVLWPSPPRGTGKGSQLLP